VGCETKHFLSSRKGGEKEGGIFGKGKGRTALSHASESGTRGGVPNADPRRKAFGKEGEARLAVASDSRRKDFSNEGVDEGAIDDSS